MVELQASHGSARGWFFTPRAGDGNHVTLPYRSLLYTLDFLAIFTLPALESLLCQSTESLSKNLSFWSLVSLFSVLLTASHGGYRRQTAEQQKSRYGLAANCFLATCGCMLTLAVILGHPNILLRHWVILDLVLTPCCLIGIQIFLAPRLYGHSHSAPPERPLVVCYGACPNDLHKALARRHLPTQIKGIFYPTPLQTGVSPPSWPIFQDLGDFRAALSSGRTQDVIFIHHPALDHGIDTINDALWEAVLTHPARIWLAFEVASNLPSILREKSEEYQLVPIFNDKLLNANNFSKRIFDMLAACVLLACAAPILLACTLLIRATSRGPIIFRQQRIGAHGRRFEVLKFRTMTYDPERGFAQACRDDPRMTRFGRWLRRTSLDELPQLFNVIRGDMSLVGPRPHAPETQVEGISFENALKLYQIRHRVKPGITGLAQIRGLRGATPVLKNLEQRLASDLEYIHSWSIWLDISILARTLPAIFQQTNAW